MAHPYESSETAPCCTCDPPKEGRVSHGSRAAKANQTTLRIAEMDCPTEERLIRQKLSSLPEVEALHFNLLERTLTVAHRPDTLPTITSALREIGFEPELPDATPRSTEAASRLPWIPMAVSGASALAAEAVSWFFGNRHPLVLALALLAIAGGGLSTYKKGWIALVNRSLNINALMTIAVTGALLIGEWPEAAMVMVLFALAERIERQSLDRARGAIRGLMALAPEQATILEPDGSWRTVDARSVELDRVARVGPGQRIPLDGTIVSGNSSVNQAPITGEALPVDKQPGDPVYAGTINAGGSFDYRITARADDTTLARIIHTVESAQANRAPSERFVDRFARIYPPCVFALALTFAITPLAFGGPPLAGVYQALVLLVIACPCALVISTPVTIVSGLAAAARHGILIKGGTYLEEGHRLRAIALDKTGTITHGRPHQTNFCELTPNRHGVESRTIAASLAHRSDHPISQAVAQSARADGVEIREVMNFAALPGRGVAGQIAGQAYRLGNHRWVEESGLCSPQLEARLELLERQAKTLVLLTNETQVLALFAVADTLKGSSQQAIAELHALGIKTVLLSGDNPHTAEAIARDVGIDESYGNLLPEDKLTALESLQASAGQIGMVGDGINDAPALARADIGFAMGAAGSDTALEAADVALMDDDLRKIPLFLRISRNTRAILRQNLVIALGIKAVFLLLAVTGQATMWMAVFADMGASLAVVFNGLRLVRS